MVRSSIVEERESKKKGVRMRAEKKRDLFARWMLSIFSKVVEPYKFNWKLCNDALQPMMEIFYQKEYKKTKDNAGKKRELTTSTTNDEIWPGLV